MDAGVAASAFALLFVAEMGDKTQLMAMTLASRHRALPVALGVCGAFLVLNLLAVAVGGVLFRYVPQRVVLGVAGLLFLAFAWSALRSGGGPDEDAPAGGGARNAVLASFLLILVAELGDKTQLAMVALVASSGAPWSVFAGGTLALWAVSLIGIAVGATVLARVPRTWLQRGTALLFGVFGVLALARAAGLMGGGG